MKRLRKQNTPRQYGELRAKGPGPRPDLPKHDNLPINRADDCELVMALARRGYDVTCRQPSDSTVAARKRVHERKQRARAALDALKKSGGAR